MVSVFSRRSLRVVFSAAVLGVLLSSLAGLAQSPELKDAYDQYTKLQATGRYAEALRVAEEAGTLGEKEFGAAHTVTANLLIDLANIYRETGKYGRAESVYKQAIVILEQKVGVLHPHWARVLNNLAVLYWSQGRFKEAEGAHKKALMVREKTLGPSHPKVAQSLNNLAEVYSDPQVKSRGMIVDLEHSKAGTIRNVGLPIKMSDTPGSIRKPAPVLGQHTAEVLAEFGYTLKEIALLKESRIIA